MEEECLGFSCSLYGRCYIKEGSPECRKVRNNPDFDDDPLTPEEAVEDMHKLLGLDKKGWFS